MTYYTNAFRADLLDEHGHVNLPALREIRGASFDRHNDLWIDHDGAFIYPRAGKRISIAALGVLGACTDALMQWERTTNGNRAFRFARADDPTERGFG